MTWLGGEQVIPRPPGSYPGGPAPWADLPPGKRRGFSLERVLAAIERPEVASDAAASVMPGVFLEGDKIPSAVLVAMFEESGEARVILTRRSQNLRFHQGEVSFPGGRCDPGESAAQCALREAQEETGLDPGLVTVTGYLSPLATFSSESFITPVVGVLAARPPMRPNPTEVDLVFDVELGALVADGVFREERWYFRVPADGGQPAGGTEVLERPERPERPDAARAERRARSQARSRRLVPGVVLRASWRHGLGRYGQGAHGTAPRSARCLRLPSATAEAALRHGEARPMTRRGRVAYGR